MSQISLGVLGPFMALIRVLIKILTYANVAIFWRAMKYNGKSSIIFFVCCTVHSVNTFYNEVQSALKGHSTMFEYAFMYIFTHLPLHFPNRKFWLYHLSDKIKSFKAPCNIAGQLHSFIFWGAFFVKLVICVCYSKYFKSTCLPIQF